MRRLSFLPLALLITLSVVSFPAELLAGRIDGIRSWICFYGSEFPSDIAPYDLYVLNSENPPDFAALQAQGLKVVGYASFGEIRQNERHFERIKKSGAIVDENPNWPGSYRVDVRSRDWKKYLLNDLIPSILAKGFDGIFIDTIDTASYLEQDKGMKKRIDAAVELLKSIRKKFPNIVIVMNNGLFLGERAVGYIDAVVVEDLFTLYDFKKKHYALADKSFTEARLNGVSPFLAASLPVLSLDYLAPKMRGAIKSVASMASKAGVIPYLSNIELNEVFFHP